MDLLFLWDVVLVFYSGDLAIVFSGSVGLDQGLDYSASIPVTEKLVGQRIAELLDGESARLPIRGTISNPDFDGEALGMDIARLSTRAALGIPADKSVEEEVGEKVEKSLQNLADKLKELFE